MAPPLPTKVPRKWYQWYALEDTPEERRLLLKLDLLILPIALLSFWIKNMDYANINNAFVSGMKEELHFYGNELVQFQTVFTVASVVGQLPFAFLFPKVPLYILIPSMEVFWGVFNLLQFRSKSFGEEVAYRFMVGIFESAFFPGVQYVLGSWYRGDEIARRGAFFYVGQTIGALSTGLLTASVASTFGGRHGLSGWRWMFIFTSVITFPIALMGYVLWPGTPLKPNKIFLTDQDVALARSRLQRHGHMDNHGVLENPDLNWTQIKKTFQGWRIWVLTIWDITFWLSGLHVSGGTYLLWIKSLKRYNVKDLNNLGSTAPGIGILYLLVFCFASDLFLGRTLALSISYSWNMIGVLILVIWNVPESAKWFAYNTIYGATVISPVFHGWANDILKHNAVERAFVLVFMNSVSQGMSAWIPLLVFQTVEAPRFTKGFSFTLALSFLFLGMTQAVRHLHKRQE
ncbi:MFS general substrate transporter [Melanomma pulvis-pyrius CBS 109.77]|uniref:MFS general substrate transporter n=1 Tax=Melanomma pulvis-pyrius CBS 109.77 TaxID=1314802 RepID=A0A6A6XJR0_9PLEO|nr:MFS general substrate transporter [Melanomma pulvis-pyrius CBS 109.77]